MLTLFNRRLLLFVYSNVIYLNMDTNSIPSAPSLLTVLVKNNALHNISSLRT